MSAVVTSSTNDPVEPTASRPSDLASSIAIPETLTAGFRREVDSRLANLDRLESRECIALGKLLAAEGHHSDAITAFVAAVDHARALSFELPESQLHLALSHGALGDWMLASHIIGDGLQAALRASNRGISDSREDASVLSGILNGVGATLLELGQYKLAASCMTISQGVCSGAGLGYCDPAMALATLQLGMAQRGLGKITDAHASFAKLLKAIDRPASNAGAVAPRLEASLASIFVSLAANIASMQTELWRQAELTGTVDLGTRRQYLPVFKRAESYICDSTSPAHATILRETIAQLSGR